MAQSKATKKFEKKHLKDTLERRNSLKKVKQRQQLKAKKKARRAEENGVDGKPETPGQARESSRQQANEAFQHMSVDDFFQGGFEVPELPKGKPSKSPTGKRKRQAESDDISESSVDFEEEPIPVDDASDLSSDDDEGNFKEQLDALAERDPEFHKLLQKDEPDVFDDLEDLQLSEDDDEQPRKRRKQGDEEDSDSEAEMPGKKELQMATVRKWRTAMEVQHSLRAAKEVVIAFRAAAYSSDADDHPSKYSVSDPEVYHELLTSALKSVPLVMQHHLPVQEGKNGKSHVPTDTKKFKSLAPLVRAQVSAIVQLLDHLSDAATLRLTLSSALPLLPYLLSFKKLVRDVLKAVTGVWSSMSSTESTRIAAFLVMRRLVVIGDLSIRENTLKATYQALVKGSRNITVHSIAGVNLMKNSAAELWGLASSEGGVAYTTAFTFIRSLAIHLRSSITNNANESYKAIYNWQYVHSLDFWSRVLAAHCAESTSPLRPLIYPLVQVTLGAMRLIPTATYFPLRFQLVRALLRVSLATGTYIPLAAPLYEVLASAELRKPPRPSTLKPLEFATAIRAAKSYLRTRPYQDGVGEQVHELLSEFFVLWTKNIAFPELALPVVVMLRRWLKDAGQRGASKKGGGNNNQKVNGMLQLLVQKLEANSRWIEERRAKVEFAPNDRKGVEAFLEDVAWEKSPLGAYVVGQRKTREEKAKTLEAARREEEKRSTKGKKNGSEDPDEDEDDGSDVEDEEMDGDGVLLDGQDDEDEDEDDDE